MPRYLVWAGVVLCLPGCTLAGLGAGATFDAVNGPYYTEKPAETVRPLVRCERIRVTTSRGVRVEGRYEGVKPPTAGDPESYLVLFDEDERRVELRYSEVTRIGVEKPGRGWVYGALVGLSLDVAAVVVLAIALQNCCVPQQGDWLKL